MSRRSQGAREESRPSFDNRPYMPVVQLWLRYPTFGVFEGWRLKDIATPAQDPEIPSEVWVREGVDCLANHASCVLRENGGVGYLDFVGRKIATGLLPNPIALTDTGNSDEVGMRAIQIVLAFSSARDSQPPVEYQRDGRSCLAWPILVPSYTWVEGYGAPGSQLWRAQDTRAVVLIEPPIGQDSYLLVEYTQFMSEAFLRRVEGVQGRGRTTLRNDLRKMAPEREPAHHFPK